MGIEDASAGSYIGCIGRILIARICCKGKLNIRPL